MSHLPFLKWDKSRTNKELHLLIQIGSDWAKFIKVGQVQDPVNHGWKRTGINTSEYGPIFLLFMCSMLMTIKELVKTNWGIFVGGTSLGSYEMFLPSNQPIIPHKFKAQEHHSELALNLNLPQRTWSSWGIFVPYRVWICLMSIHSFWVHIQLIMLLILLS